MAGKGKKFLAPAHFQVSPKKDGKETRLLPPTQYKVGKANNAGLRKQQSQSGNETAYQLYADLEHAVQELKIEKKHLQSQLNKAKDVELQLQEENRRNRLVIQRTRVDDAVDLQRLAETEEENLSLKTDIRKQTALVSKLKTEIQNIRTTYEAELESCEESAQKQNATIKQLKLELKQKEENFEKTSAISERRVKKYSGLIKELNSELHKTREQIESDRREFENILGNNEAQKYTELQRLEHERRQWEQNHCKELTAAKQLLKSKEVDLENIMKELSEKDSQLTSLLDEYRECQAKYKNELKQSNDKVHETQLSHEQAVAELQSALENCKASWISAVTELKGKLEQTEKRLDSQRSLAEQLRSYIGKNLPDTKLEKLQRENEELNSQKTNLLQENENLRTTVELLNVRLSSINELLSIQEQELGKFQRETGSVDKHADGLLTRWRMKVFALLVQLKSEKIHQQREEQLKRVEIKELKKSLEEVQRQCAVLDHALVDRTAELKLEVNKATSLERELRQSSTDSENIRTQLTASTSAVKRMYTFVQETDSTVRNIMESQMKGAFSKLTVCSQRVAFAVGRIQFLQGLFARREAKWNSELLEAMQGKREQVSEEALHEPSDCGLPYQQLLVEVERLTKERDLLTSEAKRDAGTLESKIAAVTVSYEAKLSAAESRFSELRSEYRDEKERSADLKERLTFAEEELKDASDAIESLKNDLTRHTTTSEKTLAEAISEEQARFSEEFAAVEKQLNEIQREHAKAVVALRQSERQVVREREKAAGQLQCQQMEYSQKISKLNSQLQTVEKERNMLLATVRQEGLKVPRRLPAAGHLSSSDSESTLDKENRTDNRKVSKQASSTGKRPTQGQSRNLDMAAALKDLESLSVAVLTMEKD